MKFNASLASLIWLALGVPCCYGQGGVVTVGDNDATLTTPQGVWSRVEDPPHDGLSAGSNDGMATLIAIGAVPSGADIGYASVNGATVAGSTEGFYFSPEEDFAIAVDYSFGHNSSFGGGAIGFGVGEDRGGANSAGVVLGFVSGSPLAYAATGRVNDVDVAPVEFATPATAEGRFFLRYSSLTGDVSLGVNGTPGATQEAEIRQLASIQNQWTDQPLLLSFFLRSQAEGLVPALGSGEVFSIFSNFEVLTGAPLSVPEPTGGLLAIVALLAPWRPTRQARG